MVKNLSAMQETRAVSLGWDDPLEKWMANQSSILAWRIPWTEEPGGLQSMGTQAVGHDWVTNIELIKNLEPSEAHRANSELNVTRTYQEDPGSQELQESTMHPFPSSLVLATGPPRYTGLSLLVLIAWLFWPLLKHRDCWLYTVLCYCPPV